MAPDADPYRTLGLSRGASLDDVKRAYRKLAKVNHPDAAGEAALPRFLAIQAAYEQLVGGPAGKARPRSGPTTPPRPPWQAGARGAGPRGAAGPSGPSTGSGRRRPSEPRSARGAGGPSGAPGPTPGRGTRDGQRADGAPREAGPRNKATLGSTSYDGAADQPFEPDWGGASWYGTTSGTYWTLNPKEYADPRKHGPEYQARARRAARDRASHAEAPDGIPGGPPPETDAGPIHTTSSWWESTSGDDAAPPDPGSRQAPDRGPRPPDLGQAATDLGRALTDERSGGLASRIVRAVVGWLPIAIGLGWVVGELTGCGRFAATCDGSAGPFVLAAQVGALAALLLVPTLASLATMAAIALFAAAVGAALILSATGGAADGGSRQAALGAVLLLAWLTGFAFAVVRRVRALRSSVRPVS